MATKQKESSTQQEDAPRHHSEASAGDGGRAKAPVQETRRAQSTEGADLDAIIHEQVNKAIQPVVQQMQEQVAQALQQQMDKALAPVREQLHHHIDEVLQPVHDEAQKQIEAALQEVREELQLQVDGALDQVRDELQRQVEPSIQAMLAGEGNRKSRRAR